MFIAFLIAAAAPLPEATPIDPASWFSPNNYPADARKKGVQGTVTFDVDVSAEGLPTACRVTASSGSPVLDNTTCAIVQENGRFIPATGRNGKPVSGHYSNRAVWMLQGPPPSPAGWPSVAPEGVKATPDWSDPRLYPMSAQKKNEEGSLSAALLVGSNGVPQDCRILKSSTFADLDAGTCKLMMQMRFEPAHDARGDPIPSAYSRDVNWLLIDPRPFASSTLKMRASISDGRQISCQVVGGEGPYVLAWSTLACPLLKDLPYYFGAHASKRANVSVEFRLDAGDGALFLNRPWDAAPLIASEKVSFSVDKEGEPSECTTLSTNGFGPRNPTDTSPCPSLLGLLWFYPPEPNAPPRKGFLETRVYLVGEEPAP